MDFTPFFKIIPAATLITAGCIFIPHFGFACLLTTGCIAFNITLLSIVSEFIKPIIHEEYRQLIENHILYVTLFAPILEEILFREIILNLILIGCAAIYPPSLLIPFLHLGLSNAEAISIFLTSLLFGLCHIFNAKNNLAQILCTFIAGLLLGYFFIQYGLVFAIGCHILNNILGILLFHLNKQLASVELTSIYQPPYLKLTQQ